MDENKFVKIYTDLVNGERMLTDYDFCFQDPNLGHRFTEHVNGMIWEVVGKEVDENFSATHLSKVDEASSGSVPLQQGFQGQGRQDGL